ncbi:cysteine desulfurase [Bacteroidia bacterium]|nr:cysteine desulfurase [Bacteroidia bacterium]
MNYELKNVRTYFPILQQQVHGIPLVYLDNAATTQKPQAVIDVVNGLHTTLNANIHRGVHYMAEMCTVRYEAARATVQGFLNARLMHEIIFTAGTTAGINLVAQSFGEQFVHAGDEIIVSEMEHHSNLVPWQMLCEKKGAVLKMLPINDCGELEVEKLASLISPRTKLLCVAWVSNVLGTINPIDKIVAMAHAAGVPVLLDGAQGVQHASIDVQKTDCDFFVFSGHKLYAPTGIGVLYAKEKWLEAMPPYQGGGDMVKTVSFAKTTYADLPYKFEAGTSNYIGAIGLATAINFLQNIGFDNIAQTEQNLFRYALEQLRDVEAMQYFGTSENKSPIISFVLKNKHHLDVGQILDEQGIAVRTGTLCAEPVMQHFGVTGMLRASLAFYNTTAEIDVLVKGLKVAEKMLS